MFRRRPLLTILMTILSIGLFFYIIPIPPSAALTFDIQKGIVGNLSENCRSSGDCSWCDFIDLFVILQKVILSLFGGLALIMIIWGGTTILTSAGNMEKVSQGKKLITSTLLGVLIVLGGYFLIAVLVFMLVSPRGPTGQPLPITGMFGGGGWKTAFCASPAEARFCQERGDGATCIVTDGSYTGSGVCKNGNCITVCEKQYGSQGYRCNNITSCKKNNIIGGNPANCTPDNECYTGLCPGPRTNVCCTTY